MNPPSAEVILTKLAERSIGMNVKEAIRRVVSGSLATLLITFSPAHIVFVRAEDTPACPAYAGTTQPTGSAAVTYTFSEETCLWENDYYAWSAETKQYTKKTPYDYTYSPGTGTWRKVEPPVPVEPVAEEPSAASLTTDNTGPDSSNTVDQEGNVSVGLDSTTNVSADNNLNSIALSGNAYVGGNTWGGSATSGDAMAAANIINMLQSTSGFGGDISTFSADINGDVYGDLFLDPALLSDLQGAGNFSQANNLEVDVNDELNSSIYNDITLDAASGDATVHSNTNAGDATTGNANAVLNLVNMINSAINSGESFLGMLNIYGNLNGDILLPPEVLNQVIANNAPETQVNSSVIENTDILANFDNDQTITNNLDLAASSGNALVDGNANAGGATTGNGETNLTVLNLTGRDVIAANSLLVFVNVLGQWVGLIMDAPAGSTAAALGTDVSQNTVSNADIDINASTDSEITNDVDLDASSGDASVRDNTNAGNATTGNATASTNIVNIINSRFALSDWFGILFINVFGTWNGSFGVDTLAGGMAGAASSGGSGGMGDVQVFTFVPGTGADGRLRVQPANVSGGSGESEGNGVVLASAHIDGSGTNGSTYTVDMSRAAPQGSGRNYPLMFGSLAFGAMLLGAERFLPGRRRFITTSAFPVTRYRH